MTTTKTPTAMRLLRGDKHTERMNHDAPIPAGGLVMPRGMTPRARAVWHRQTKAMAATGIFTGVDSDALRAYCDAVARYEIAAELLAEQGPLVPSRSHDGKPDGPGMVKNPLHQVVRDNALLVLRLAEKLGFVPTARENLRAKTKQTDGDAFDRWAAGG